MGGFGSGKPPRVDRKIVVGLARRHPEYSNVEIGRLVGGISRERVRQIFAEEGFSREYLPKCSLCGTAMPRDALQSAGRVRRKRARHCAVCAAKRKIERKSDPPPILMCDQCGQTFTKPAAEQRAGKLRGSFHDWCSQRCRAGWFEALRKKSGLPLAKTR
jgi:ribosomal protein L37AE/L43A